MEMRGLLLLARLIRALLPGFPSPPTEIFLAGDSQCTIASVEADDRLLDVWFANRVAEVKDEMASWSKSGIIVHPLYHWPGIDNIADLATKGKANLEDITEDSSWQNGPARASFPQEDWPALRDFVRIIPEEEKRSPLFQVHHAVLQVVSNCLKADEKVTGNVISKLTPDGGILDETEANSEASVKKSKKASIIPLVKMVKQIETLMSYSNDLQKVKAILARVIQAHAKGDRAAIEDEPTVTNLQKAEKLLFIVSAAVKTKLAALDPVYEDGMWIC